MFPLSIPANIVGIAGLLVCQSVEMLLDHEVDGAWRGIRQEVLEFLGVHGDVTTYN